MIRTFLWTLAESLATLAVFLAPVGAYRLGGLFASPDLAYHVAGASAVVALFFLWLILTLFFGRGGWSWERKPTELSVGVVLPRRAGRAALRDRLTLSVSLFVIHLRIEYGP